LNIKNILLVTPPQTQLNTPYPAMPYLTRFLRKNGFSIEQLDLGIELILNVFTKEKLSQIFQQAQEINLISQNSQKILANESEYLATFELVIRFLQNKDNTLAHRISRRDFLPEASRFDLWKNTDDFFSALDVSDLARFLCTLYMEDLADLMVECIDPDFGFARYAEPYGISANTFEPIEERLNRKESLIETTFLEILNNRILSYSPEIVGITIPFSGCVIGALKCAQQIKKNFPNIKIVIGGGWVNTDLRQLVEPKVFDYVDFITLDDGETPILSIFKFLESDSDFTILKRTYIRIVNLVKFIDNEQIPDVSFSECGVPDYSGLQLENYLSFIETPNPMLRLWLEGRWNKMTLAHGCYWQRCAFCDITLPYINHYEIIDTTILVDHIEEIIAQTQQTGFHFVDEAAPPKILEDLANELIRRNLKISWWTNIRFEAKFTLELCQLLAKSGCIAVSGGIETASDRLLKLMKKGVSIKQAAKTCYHFTECGIMIHAYLMYGFPTQTEQELIDSLEIVRQFFENNLIQSAYWHLFALTAHSEVGINPEQFGIEKIIASDVKFAYNDVYYDNKQNLNYERFTQGLNKSVFNFMLGLGTELPIKKWFDFSVLKPLHSKNMIKNIIEA